MKDFYDFAVGVLDATAWPAVVFFAYFIFRNEIKSVFSRLLSGELLGAKIKLQTEKEYLETAKAIETTGNEEERESLQQQLIQPKNENITPEEGAELIAAEIIRRMNNRFTLTEFSNQFDSFFSSSPEQASSEPVKHFKSMVIEKLRLSKRVLESNENGELVFKKLA